MTISDRPASVTPPALRPSFVRRHPILAGFGVLSGLSLFSALWPVSAIVITVAVAADATGLDRKAWSLTRSVAERIASAMRGRAHADPSPSPPTPAAPAPQPSAPRRDVHPPSTATARVRREPRAQPPTAHAPGRARHPRKADHPVETRMDGRGL
ncbi:MAG TPA: hypothetical protein VMU65_10135 [Candidatus Saccharimonadales bacterium]|nr:hypothetical protein [Candidatus Saccharimonadales bacterium]